jgi:hypothetical protein
MSSISKFDDRACRPVIECANHTPWKHGQIVSWWDVYEISGPDLHRITAILETIRCDYFYAVPKGDHAFSLGAKPILLDAQERGGLEQRLRVVANKMEEFELSTTGEAVIEFCAALQFSSFQISATEVVARIDEILRTLAREMKGILFLCVVENQARFYRRPQYGWDEVIKRWPQTTIDIEECSKCLACDRYAAAIFHVLLIAEFGVIELAKLLNVAGDKPGWGALSRLEKILKVEYPQRSALEQKHSQFLEHVLPLMLAIQTSWRHKISHVENRLQWIDTDFSAQLALEIVSATRGFMRQLATDMPR